jgi:hypothetical protein
MNTNDFPYWKPVIALIGSVAFALATGIGAGELGDIDGAGWVYIIALVVGGPAATWFAENILGVAGGIIKAFLAASGVALAALTTGYETDNALSQAEILLAVAGFLTTLTVAYQVPGPVPVTAAVVPTEEVGATRTGTVQRKG